MPRHNLNLIPGGVAVDTWKQPQSTDEWLQLILQEIKALRHDGTTTVDSLKVQEMEIESLTKRTEALEKWQAVVQATGPRRRLGYGTAGAIGAGFIEAAVKVYGMVKHP